VGSERCQDFGFLPLRHLGEVKGPSEFRCDFVEFGGRYPEVAVRLLKPERVAGTIRRIVSLLLHFSTVSWFLGGLALVAAAIWLKGDARLATGLFVGSLYVLAALGNLWATRGRHPGWMLMAAAEPGS
jgi:hypothetical protein